MSIRPFEPLSTCFFSRANVYARWAELGSWELEVPSLNFDYPAHQTVLWAYHTSGKAVRLAFFALARSLSLKIER